MPTTAAGYTIFNQNVLLTSSKTATGTYTINFKEPWLNLTQWNIGLIATPSTTFAQYGQITSQAISQSSGPNLVVKWFNPTTPNTPVDLQAGDQVYLYFGFRFKKGTAP
jgi:hypothetical protein